jgi:hypothetical protein
VDKIAGTAVSDSQESGKGFIDGSGSPRLQTLNKSLKSLKDHFNKNRDKVRFLALLSPM